MKIQRGMECWASVLSLTFGTSVDGRAVSYNRRQHFMPHEISWYSFLLEAEFTSGLMNVRRRNEYLENFPGAYRKWKPEPQLGTKGKFVRKRFFSPLSLCHSYVN